MDTIAPDSDSAASLGTDDCTTMDSGKQAAINAKVWMHFRLCRYLEIVDGRTRSGLGYLIDYRLRN